MFLETTRKNLFKLPYGYLHTLTRGGKLLGFVSRSNSNSNVHFVANQKPFLTDLNHDISLNEQGISRNMMMKKVVLSEEMKNI